MQRRRLGRTGLEVSEIGYGAWGISGVQWEAEDDESIRALNRAIDLGLNFIDTAAAYGDGHSERLVGQVVRASGRAGLCSQQGPPKNLTWPAAEGSQVEDVFPGEHVRRFTERTLLNLGLETLDIQRARLARRMARPGRLAGDGRGAARRGQDPLLRRVDQRPRARSALRIVGSGIADTVQVIYNIFDQSAAVRLFGAVREHDVGVIVRVALDEGGLTGRITPDSTFPEGDFRNHYFRGERKQAVMERVDAIVEDLGIEVDDMAATALRFVLSEPAVSTVIPGCAPCATWSETRRSEMDRACQPSRWRS